MLRANRLATFNKNSLKETLMDTAFKELGGTAYLNFFTPGPDTPRGIATYLTGINPYKNGCNTRSKWPHYFLNKDLETIFDIFIQKDFKIDCFANPKERDAGLFPSHITEMDIHNHDLDLNKYLSTFKPKNNHFVFISLPDFHWALDDYGYNIYGENKAYNTVKSSFESIFKNLDKNEFDHIFIFSDHGFKFNFEKRLEDPKMMLNSDRTNAILIHRSRNQNTLTQDDRLCSLEDLMPTYKQILNIKHANGHSILSEKFRKFIVIEDHVNFAPSINQNVELWAVVDKYKTYIRSLDSAITIHRSDNIISEGLDQLSDKILLENSSFKFYLDEHNKIFRYRDNILSKDTYINGTKRIEKSKLHRRLFDGLDLLKSKIYTDL